MRSTTSAAEWYADARQRLFESYIDAMGPRPSWSRPHRRFAWEARRWAIKAAIGNERIASPRLALFRCATCGMLLTTAGLSKNDLACGNCGGRQYTDRIGNAGFWAILNALLHNR